MKKERDTPGARSQEVTSQTQKAVKIRYIEGKNGKKPLGKI